MARILYFLGLLSVALGYNCTTIREACPTLKCDLGFVVDAFGCPSCKCNTAPTTPPCPNTLCEMYCANGYEMSADGCPSCKCKAEAECPCGRTCAMKDGTVKGICQADGKTCAENIQAPRCTTCSNSLCKIYCEFGNVIDENGCQQCACNPNPNPSNCPCGSQCKTPVGGEGQCSEEGLCVSMTVPVLCEKKCPEKMCMMYCPFGAMVDTNGCPTCTCNPDPAPCKCGDSCPFTDTVKGVCNADGRCMSDLKEPCKPVCDGLMCKMFCPYGNVITDNGCPSCQCNPAPPMTEACRCGEVCKAGGDLVGLCQADGTCDARALTKPQCPTTNCPAVMCMMYCEHGTLMDEATHCPTCKCNPPPQRCVCGEPCVSARGNGTCQSDGFTCAALPTVPQCEKLPCPAVKCALYCPGGNAMDANGCTTCRCNPDPLPACKCGEKCTQSTGAIGICQSDNTCGSARENGVICSQNEPCPPLMCNLYCPNGNALTANGCATCACQPEKIPCKCGEVCYDSNKRAGVCMEDGSCGALTTTKPMCEKRPCPAMRCMTLCPAGNEIDENGCPTCRCKPTKPCPCGTKCAVDEKTTGVCTAEGVCGGVGFSVEEVRKMCSRCPAKLCMTFCPRGNALDAMGCPTCQCLDEKCPCGTECKTPNSTLGICKADGTCLDVRIGRVNRSDCVPTQQDCPMQRCLHHCANGNIVDAKGCPTCECKPDPLPCPCGTKCPTGVCQEDGKTCAVNIRAPVCEPVPCPKMMCTVLCPNGQAVDANGCPTCKCNPVQPRCPCGRQCKMPGGEGEGVCQSDDKTCAINKMAPTCRVTSDSATACVAKTCDKFCEFGTILDDTGCPTCECQTSCPCGASCTLKDGLIGACNSDGVTCVSKARAGQCAKATGGGGETSPATMPEDGGSSSSGVIAAIVIITLLLAVSVGLLICRRTQRKVATEHNYADLDPASGYVAPQAVGV